MGTSPTLPPPTTEDSSRRGGRFRSLVRRRPVAWLVGTAVFALAVGAAAGQTDTVPRADLDEAKQANASLTDDLKATRTRSADLEHALDKATREADETLAEARRITARGTVPSLISGDIDDANDNSVVDDLEWKVRQQTRVSGAEPGTVISQRPRAGATWPPAARTSPSWSPRRRRQSLRVRLR